VTAPAAAATGRPRHRGIWLAVAVLTAVIVAGAAGAVAARVVDGHTSDWTSRINGKIGQLVVDSPGADITLTQGTTRTVRIQHRITWWLGARPFVRQTLSPGTLRVRTGEPKPCPQVTTGPPCGVALTIQVPPGVSVLVAADSGAVTAQGLTGPVHVDLTSGAATLVGLRGPVWARAQSGAISARRLASPQVDASVSTGYLALGFTVPPRVVRVAATSGAVSVLVPRSARYRVLISPPKIVRTRGISGKGRHLTVDPGLIDKTSRRTIDVTITTGIVRVWYQPPN
jgi:hypothetical protein